MRFPRLLLIGILTLLVGSNAFAEILFQDNFEAGEIDESKWSPTGGWSIVENADGHTVLGEFVLDINGGDEGLSVMEFPEEFDYYADFKAMEASLAAFIFHGQDTNNIYMFQVSVTGSAFTPQHIRWHRKVGGAYTAEPDPFADEKDRDIDVWYRVKFEVRGFDFKAYLGDVGAAPNELVLVSEWTDSEESFKEGKIGFRESGSEHAQFDNVVVATPGTSIMAVYPQNKLALTWGMLKIQK